VLTLELGLKPPCMVAFRAICQRSKVAKALREPDFQLSDIFALHFRQLRGESRKAGRYLTESGKKKQEGYF
jgi:hypothetical protein